MWSRQPWGSGEQWMTWGPEIGKEDLSKEAAIGVRVQTQSPGNSVLWARRTASAKAHRQK
jgi:hypothetical protein